MSPLRDAVRVLFGFPVHAVTIDDAVERCAAAIRTRRSLLIGAVNAAKIVRMRRDRRLRDAVLAANFIVADGTSVVWASRLLGRALPERVTGVDLFFALLELADRDGRSVYLLGARPETLRIAIARIREDYPGVHIVGSHHGYFAPEDVARIEADIRFAAPDMIFVGMTSPRKEQFLAAASARIGVPVCHGVGGSFDILAGTVRRAPARWQRLGCEWLYRLIQEPRRLWRRYLVTNTLFLLDLAREFVHPSDLRTRTRAPAATTPARAVVGTIQPLGDDERRVA